MTPVTKLFLYGCLAISLSSARGHAQEAAVTVDPVVRQSFVRTVPILGRLVAKQSGTVASRIAGAINEILIQVGDQVTQGQLIAIIDTEPLTLQKRIAEAQQKEVKARIATARAELNLASQEVKRMHSLQNSAAVSKAVRDDADQNQKIAFAKVREAEAAGASSVASINLADLNLQYARVIAPFNGTVTAKLTEIGSYVQRGDPVIQLVSNKLLELEADIPAARLAGLSTGKIIEFSFENDDRLNARVRAIVPEENPNTRTRRVRFHMDSETGQLTLAVKQSVTLYIPAGVEREVLAVHKDAVIHKGKDNIVYVVEENLAKLRVIQIGEAIGNRLEVRQGLAEGERAVVRGNERLRPEQPVVIADDRS